LPLPPRLLQLAIALGKNLRLASFQLGQGRDVADRAVQTNPIVMVHVPTHQAARVVDRQRHSWPDTLPFQRLVPPLDLAVRLRIERRGPHMGHAADPDELLEVAGDELRPVVGPVPRRANSRRRNGPSTFSPNLICASATTRS